MKRILVCLLLLCPSAAPASPLTLYGFNARGVAMADAQTAAAEDGTAAFFNPALLTRPLQVTFGFGVQYVHPGLQVRSLASPFDPDAPPVQPEGFGQWTLHVVFPLGGKVANRVALGVGLSMPVGYIVRVQSIDSRQPYFYMFEASAEKMVLLPAFAFRLTDRLSVGAGLQILADLGGVADVEVDVFAQRVKRRSMSIELVTRQALTAGVSAGPFEGLTVGASYRQELGLDYQVPARVEMEDLGVLDLTLQGTAVWSPHELSLGAAWDLPGLATLISFDVTYALWSRAPNPQVMVVLDTGGELLEGLGLGDTLDLCSEQAGRDAEGGRTCTAQSPGFLDNLVPRLGVEHRVSEVLALRGGWWYWPTPVPNQTGRTNYLDASAHHLSLGVGITFDDPLEVFAQPITVDLSGRATFLSEREVDKLHDGSADYAFGGTLFQAAASVRYRY